MRLLGMISENEERQGFDFRMNQVGDFILSKNGTVLATVDPRAYSLDGLRREIREVIWVNDEMSKLQVRTPHRDAALVTH